MITNTLRNEIELKAKDTVGYSEAENKDSFMVGVSVGFTKAQDHYEKELSRLQGEVEEYKSASNKYLTDLKFLSSIITSYSEEVME